MTRKDWEKLMNMSKEEIEQNAKNDSDNPPFSTENLRVNGMLCPDGFIVRSIVIEEKIDNWLEEHNLQGDKIAATLLKQFVEAQSGIK
jgi:hypothetical protein